MPMGFCQLTGGGGTVELQGVRSRSMATQENKRKMTVQVISTLISKS